MAATGLACGNYYGGRDLTISQPEIGEALIAGTRATIVWKSAVNASPVDVLLRQADGTVTPIATRQPSIGRVTWNVPLLDPQHGAASVVVEITRDQAAATVVPADQSDTPRAEVPVGVGAFASFYWDPEASVEHYYWVDCTTGTRRNVGVVGDLAEWQAHAAASLAERSEVYVAGTDPAGATKLYTLNAISGELLRTAPLENLQFAEMKVNAAGELLTFRWNGAVEEMVRIDTVTGAQTVIGTVGDLLGWFGEWAIDLHNDRVYAFGENAAGQLKLYTLDASSGVLLRDRVVAEGGVVAMEAQGIVTNSRGDLLGFRWNGTVQELVRIDTSTGRATAIGLVGDLHASSAVAAVNLTSDQIYTVGNNDIEDKLYVMDSIRGDFLYDVPVDQWPGVAILVYSDTGAN
jgi:hypothetical protein